MTEKGSVMDNVFEQEKAYAEKLNSLDFLNFLFNVINPNEMEQYISMYLCSGEKSLSNANADMDAWMVSNPSQKIGDNMTSEILTAVGTS